jgi:MSHA biogenesis protein MshJ
MQLEDLKNQFKGLADRIDAMSLRERALIFITVLVAVYLVAVNLLFGPTNTEKDLIEARVNQLREETQKMDVQIQSMLAGGAHDADAAKRQKIASLQTNLKQMDASLTQVTSGLVPPKEMTRLIEQMLLKNRGLQVLKMESLPAAPLLEGSGDAAPSGTMVYKHGMRIELKGGYLDILRYLKSLEGLQWKVFWGQVTLKTDKYPDSDLTLLIYTLSTHEGWIGL